VKPQFEVGRSEVGPGGIVREPKQHVAAVVSAAAAARRAGLSVQGLCASPILGAEGNREFFLLLAPGESGWSDEEVSSRARQVSRLD
jgi:23S rRNA (cytidine1920-2'-O)/16S rRNA (cytidine1409-2'-O)-methyltransferase